jgi:hypothetical protein
MTGVIVAVTITRRDPGSSAAWWVAIIAADPDPASTYPFMMTGNPDRAGIRAAPGSVNNRGRRWRRGSDANAEGLGGRRRRSDK